MIIFITSLLAGLVQANPIVCFNTNMGEICMELYEDKAPQTVSNFLKYVSDGDYESSFFHRSVAGFIIQGGGFTINDTLEINAVPIDSTVLNEYSLSNTRGTVAMAKLGGDPDSATSQWFINLSDNSANLDNQNGGFTVFAKIIDNDMTIVDSIAALPSYNLNQGANFTDTPLYQFDNTKTLIRDNFVVIENAYEKESIPSYTNNKLYIRVDAGTLGKYQLSLGLTNLQSYDFQLDMNSLIPIQNEGQTNAIYNPQTGILTMEKIELDNQQIVNDVELTLTDAGNYSFRLSWLNGQSIIQVNR